MQRILVCNTFDAILKHLDVEIDQKASLWPVALR